MRLDDWKPHVYRTHDFGKTWKEVVRGLPDDPVNAVREDPVRKGLLYAATERAVFVSLDEGENWQSLRLNMPATSVRDLVVHGDDLVVGTHGRSFWILDDVTPLRQLEAKVASAEAHLFAPQTAYRVRWNVNTDTPLPPEEPAGQNPPDGAIINYYLKAPAPGPVTLEIFDAKGKLVRRFASTDRPEPVNEKELAIPTYWIRPPQMLSAKAGAHRFIWDLHYSPPEGGRRTFPIAAVYRNTPSAPLGPWVHPGQYRVKLTVGGKSYEQPLTVKMDPRVKTPETGLRQQYALSMECYEGMKQARATLGQIKQLREKLKELRGRAEKGPKAEALAKLDAQLAALEGAPVGKFGFGKKMKGGGEASLSRVSGEMGGLLRLLQGADATPTTQAVAACAEVRRTLAELLARWNELNGKGLKALEE
jgi:hypothetical protein